MRIFQFVFFLVLIVSSVFHLAESEMHRFCGDHGDCKFLDHNHPVECCIKGNLNGYHECLDNPNPGARCPPLPTFN